MKESPKRLAPSIETIRILFALSGNQCAFPGCEHPIIDEENDYVAQICHIEGVMPGGERFNRTSNNQERGKPENLLLLCHRHHKKTDNELRYPVEELRRMKSEHEAQFRNPGRAYVPNPDIITAVYYEELRNIEARLNTIVQNTESLKDTTQSIQVATAQILEVVSRDAQNTEASSATLSEIDAAMNWRMSHQYKKAIAQLSDIKKDKWPRLSHLEKYKVLANIGICHMDMGQNELASQYYIDALPFQPDRLRAITLAALGHALTGNHDQAREFIQRALATEPGNADAYIAQITLDAKNLPFQQIVDNIPAAYRQNPNIAINLANAARNLKDLSSAINWAEIALELAAHGDKTHYKGILAGFVLESIHNTFTIFTGHLSRHTLNTAKYVIELYTELLQQDLDTTSPRFRSKWLCHRGLAKRIAGDVNGSYEDMLEAVAAQRNIRTLEQLYAAAVRCEKYVKADEIVEQMESIAGKAELPLVQQFKAELLLVQKQYAQAIPIFENLTKQTLPPEDSRSVNYLLIDAYRENRQVDKANRLIEELIAREPNLIPPYLLKAKLEKEQKNDVRALETLQEAYLQVTADSRAEDIRELAIQLQMFKAHEKAIQLYERITDLSCYSQLTKELLKLYHQAGQTQKTIELCNHLIAVNGVNFTLAEHLVVSYDFLNDVKKSIQSCKTYLDEYPDDQRMIFRLALIYSKTNQVHELRKLFEKIEKLDAVLNTEVQFRMASLCIEIGDLEKCYRFAYKIWSENYNKRSAHECLAQIATQGTIAGKSPKDPGQVTSHCAVVLDQDSGKKITYLITPNGNSGIPAEIATNDPIAEKLLGHKVGETLSISEKTFHIAEILHPFNFAVTASFRLLHEKFIDSTVFKSFQHGNTGDLKRDFQKIFEMLDKREEDDKHFDTIYRQHPITLGMIAAARKENPIKIWNQYLEWDTPGIAVIDSLEDISLSIEQLRQNQDIIIDPITLNSMANLNLLDQLAQLPHKKVVAQSSLNHFYELIREFAQHPSGMKRIGKANGQYIRQEFSPTQLASYQEFLTKLVAWIQQHCRVLPCEPTLNMLAKEKKEMDDLLGQSVYETLLIARQNNCLLYAEESRLRNFALNQYQVTGFNSYVFALYLNSQNQITTDEFNQVTQKMIQLNYHTLPINSQVLITILEEVQDHNHPAFKSALAGIKSPIPEIEHNFAAYTHFYFKLLNSQKLTSAFNGDPDFLEKTVVSSLELLFKQFEPAKAVYDQLIACCNQAFSTNEKQKDDVTKMIDEYYSKLEGKK